MTAERDPKATDGTPDEDDSWLDHYGNEVPLDDSCPDVAYSVPLLGPFALWAGANTDAPALATLVTGYAFVGGLVGRTPRYVLDGHVIRALPFGLFVGPTGAGKGTAHDVYEPVRDLMETHDRESLITTVNSGEGMKRRLSKVPTLPDGSSPARLVIPEFAAILRASRREGSTISQAIRELHDGGSLQRDLSSPGDSSSRVDAPAATMIGHITPAELRAESSSLDAQSGLLSRFMVIPVPQRELDPEGRTPYEGYKALAEGLDAVVRRARGLDEPMGLHREAEALLRALQGWQRLIDRQPGNVASILRRTVQHVARMTPVATLLRWDGRPGTPIVLPEDVLAAAAVAAASPRTVSGLWGGRPGNTREAKIITKVRRADRKGGVTRSELLALSTYRFRDAWDDTIGRMLDDGLLRKHKSGNGYRIFLGATEASDGLWAALRPETTEVGVVGVHPSTDGVLRLSPTDEDPSPLGDRDTTPPERVSTPSTPSTPSTQTETEPDPPEAMTAPVDDGADMDDPDPGVPNTPRSPSDGPWPHTDDDWDPETATDPYADESDPVGVRAPDDEPRPASTPAAMPRYTQCDRFGRHSWARHPDGTKRCMDCEATEPKTTTDPTRGARP